MSRQSIIDTAAAELGTKESPPNSNRTKFGQWYGLDGEKWCAIFVSWVFHHAGHPLEAIDRAKGYQSCQSGFVFWRRNNRITRSPEPGDIVLYDWTGDGHCDHTGIFAGWIDPQHTRFFAWEGNTAQGNDSDGGQVMRRERSKAAVRAFVTPFALDAAPRNPADQDDTIRRGDRGADVAVVQRLLHDLGSDIIVDGDFGVNTENSVKAFQRKHALDETGVVTPEFFAILQEDAAQPRVPVKRFTSGAFLQNGDSGEAVMLLQRALIADGAGNGLDADGVFGRATGAALRKFQQANGLEVDGIAGPATFKALKLTAV